MKRWHCESCSWEGKSPDTVVVFYHKCRYDRVRRELHILDPGWNKTKEDRLAEEDNSWFLEHWQAPPPHDPDKKART